MKRVWDTIAVIIVTAIVIAILLQMIAPFIPYIIIGAVVVLGARYCINRAHRW